MDSLDRIVHNQDGVLWCSECEPQFGDAFAAPKVCTHIKQYILQGLDAHWIRIGDMLQVPVFPSANVWAQVTIEGAGEVNTIGKMKLVYFDDLNVDRSVQIGLWTAGDGRLSIRAAILELIRSRIHPDEDFTNPDILTRCPNPRTHTFVYSEQMRKNTSLDFKQATVWSIAMEQACLGCREATLPSTPDPKDGETNRVNPGKEQAPSDPFKVGQKELEKGQAVMTGQGGQVTLNNGDSMLMKGFTITTSDMPDNARRERDRLLIEQTIKSQGMRYG